MTTFSWISGISGDWMTLADWSPHFAPNTTAADAVITDVGTYTVTIGVTETITINSVTLAAAGATFAVRGTLKLRGANATLFWNAGTLVDSGTIDGGTIAVAGYVALGSSVSGNGTLSLASGQILLNGYTFTAANAVLGNGNYYSSGGHIDGPGTLATTGAATIDQQYYNNNYDAVALGGGATWVNSGAVTLNGAVGLGDAAGTAVTIINQAAGTFNFAGAYSGLISYYYDTQAGGWWNGGAHATLSNAGTLTTSNGANAYIDAFTTNTGVINAGTGYIEFDAGGAFGGTLAGSIDFGGGTAEIKATASLGGASLGESGGGVTLDAAETLASWSMSGGVLTQAAGSTVSTASFSQTGGQWLLNGGTLAVGSGGASFGNGGEYDGTIDGAGTFTTSGTTSISDAQYNYGWSSDGDFTYYQQLVLGGGATWVNSGTVNETGAIAIGDAAGGTANITNVAGATFNLAGGDANVLTGHNNPYGPDFYGSGTFTNTGTLAETGGGLSVIGLTMVNTGTLNAGTGTLQFDAGGTFGGTLAGSIDFGGGTAEIKAAATLSGASLGESGGSVTLDAAETLASWSMGGGVLTQAAGTTVSAASFSQTGGQWLLNGGTLAVGGGGAGFGNGGEYDGTIDGAGTFTTSGTTSISDAQYNYGWNSIGDFTYYAQLVLGGGATWVNSGTVNETGAIAVGDAAGGTANITNVAGATFNLTGSDANVLTGHNNPSGPNFYGSGTFTNAGTLAETGGGSSVIALTMVNTGTINTGTGSLQFDAGGTFGGTLIGNIAFGQDYQGGAVEIAAAANVAGLSATEGGGTVTFDVGETLTYWGMLAGVLTQAAGSTVSVASFSQTGQNGGQWLLNGGTLSVGSGGASIGDGGRDGSIDGPGAFTTSGVTSISDANYNYEWSGNGNFTYNAQLVIGGGATWVNSGTVNETGAIAVGDYDGDTGNITNVAGAVFNLTGGDAQVLTGHYDNNTGVQYGSGTFTNAGTLAETGGGLSVIGLTMVNTGTLNAGTGTLQFDAGGTFGGALIGSLAFAGGAAEITAASTLTNVTLGVNGAAVTLDAVKPLVAINMYSGSLMLAGSESLTSAYMSGGVLTQAAGSTVSAVSFSQIGGQWLLNGGTLAVGSGGASFGDGNRDGTINGAGTFTTSGTTSISDAGYNYGWSSDGDFTYNAQLVIGGGATWVNSGTVNATGAIAVGDYAGSTGNITNLAGAAFNLTGGDAQVLTGHYDNYYGFLYGSGTFTNAGTLAETGGGLSVIGLAMVDTGTLNVGTGTLQFDGGGTFSGALTGKGGSVNFAGGGTINAGATLTGTGTVNFAGGYGSLGGGGTLVNSGTLAFQGGYYDLSGVSLNNTGTITDTGGTLLLGNVVTLGATNISNTTIDLAGTISYANYTTLHNSAASKGNTLAILGTLVDTGVTLTVGASGPLPTNALSWDIKGGVLIPGSALTYAGGTLDGVTVDGALNLSTSGASLAIATAFNVFAANGTGAGAVAVNAAGAVLDILGTQVLNTATLNLGNTAGYATLAEIDAAGTGTTLTLGGAFKLQSGAGATLGQVLAWDAAGNDALVNSGGIAVTTAGQIMVLSANTFTNKGSVSIAAGDLELQSGANGTGTGSATNAAGATISITNAGTLNLGAFAFTYTNAGTMTQGSGLANIFDNLVNSGTITQTAGTLGLYGSVTNSGTLSLSGGTLVLGGGASISSTGSVSIKSETVNIYGGISGVGLLSLLLTGSGVKTNWEGGAGYYDNSGQTLNVGTGTSLGTIPLNFVIIGGTINDAGGGLKFSSTPGALYGVSYIGSMTIGAAGSLDIGGGMSFAGAAGKLDGLALTGSGALLDVQDNQLIDYTTVTIGAGAGGNGDTLAMDDNGSTLTFGAHATLTSNAGTSTIGSGYASDSIVNLGGMNFTAGTIILNAGGAFSNAGSMSVGGTVTLNAGTIVDTGSIGIKGGVLTLNGATTLSSGGTLTDASGGVLIVNNLLALGGDSLSFGGATQLQLNGTAQGGTLVDTGGGITLGNGASLAGMTYDGTITVNSYLFVSGGLTAQTSTGGKPGTINVNGGVLGVTDSETLDNVVIALGSGQLDAWNGAGGTLTLGSHATLNAGNAGYIDSYNYYGYATPYYGAIVNAGTINVAPNAFFDGLNWSQGSFTNDGTISVGAGATFGHDNGGPDTESVTNAGLISLAAGATFQTSYGGFVNTGTIAMASTSTLDIQGNVTVANLGSIATNGGLVEFDGTLNLGGGTMDVKSGGLFGNTLLTGTVTNGTILPDGGTLAFGANVTLDAVTFAGPLTVAAGSTVRMQDGATLQGTANVGGNLELSGFTDLTQNVTLTGGGLYFDGATELPGNPILSTGVGSNGLELPGGSADPHWSVVGGGSAVVLSQGNLYIPSNFPGITNYWVPDTSTSAWVSNIDSRYGITNETLTFINVFNVSTLSGTVIACSFEDDNLGTISLNGTVVAGYGYTGNAPQQIVLDAADGLVQGSNTLSVAVTGDYITNGFKLDNGLLQPQTIDTGVVVSGNGALGDDLNSNGYTEIQNNGTVLASGGTLVVSPSLFLNDGVLRAQAGAALALGGNDGVADAFVNNATLDLSAGSATEAAGSFANAGTITIGASQSFVSAATLANTGTVTLAQGATLSDGGALSNSGLIVASGTGTAYVVASGGFGNLASGTLTGGTLQANAGAKLDIQASGTVTTLASGTIYLVGAGSELSFWTGSAYATIESTLTTVASGGALTIGAARGYTTGKTLTVSGQVQLVGGTLSDGATTLNATGRLFGSGTIAKTVVSAGTIEASNGLLKLAGTVTGAGVMQVDANSTLEVAAGSSQGTVFKGAGGRLQLDAPSSYTAAIIGFAIGDSLQLQGVNATGAVYSGGTLTVSLASGGPLSYTLSGSLANTRWQTVGGTNSTITLYGQAVAAPITPATVAFGAVHVGAAESQPLTVSNSATASPYNEGLDASFASLASGVTGTGAVTTLSAGGSTSSAMAVGITTTTDGVRSGAAVIALASDGAGIDQLGTLALASQTVNVSGTVWAYAAPSLGATTLNFGATRVGGTVAGQNVVLANGAAADPYQESLLYGTTANGGFSVSSAGGTIASGGSVSLGVSLSTAVSGDFTASSLAVSLTSDGLATSGLANTALPGGTVTLNGKVYAAAVAQVAPTVSFGVVHVGDTANQLLVVSNVAIGALTDVINGGFSSVVGTGFNGSGTVSGVVAGGSGNLALGLATGTNGVFTGTASLALVSHDADQSDLSLTTAPVSLTGTVDAYAVAALSLISGSGTLSGGGATWVLNLGSVQVGAAVSSTLGVVNAATGQADVLGGGFQISGSSLYTNTGFATFSGLTDGTGQIAGGDVIALATNQQAGTFSETIVLNATGSNASGYSGALAAETLTVTGTIVGSQTYTLTTGADTVTGTIANDTIDAATNTLSTGDKIDGGGGTNTLVLQGGGTFNENLPTTLANVQVVQAQEGAGSTLQTLTLRNGLTQTVTAASGAAGSSIVINAGTNSSIINLGNGADTVTLGSAGQSVFGGGGADRFNVTAASIGATINGGTGASVLAVSGGGTMTMGANITSLASVTLVGATPYNFTANAIASLLINNGGGANTVTVGAATQVVNAQGGAVHVRASAATAGAKVIGASGAVLEITGGGTATLNQATSAVTVTLDAASNLTLSKATFITAIGSGGNDTLTALAASQTLTGGAGTDTLVGSTGGGDIFLDSTAGLNGDTIKNWVSGDTIDLTDMTYATVQPPSYAGSQLTVTDGTHTAVINFTGSLATHNFALLGPDSNGGTLIGWHS